MKAVNPKSLLIIGAGFAGTVSAIRLLHNAIQPLRIIILERENPKRFGGVAFGSAGWEHMLNLQAGRISIFREHRKDFLNWINLESNQTNWPSMWQRRDYNLSSAVPRLIYQQYLKDRLKDAEVNSSKFVTLEIIQGEAIDLIESSQKVTVKYLVGLGGKNQIIEEIVDSIIIATGHLESVLPDFASEFGNNPHFVRDQYSKEGIEKIQKCDSNGKILIIGTGLRAYDAVLSMIKKGHSGPITLCSRKGLTHSTYHKDHVHEIISLRRPLFLNKEGLTKEEIIKGVKIEFEFQFNRLKSQYCNLQESVITERILKGWEPFVKELIEKLTDDLVYELYEQYKSIITTLRVGVIPEISDQVLEMIKNTKGNVNILRGRIVSLRPGLDNLLARILNGSLSNHEEIEGEFDLVISCVGRETDYSKINNALWRNLIDLRELAIPHKKTKRGIEVDEEGRLINSLGIQSDRIFAVGVMREGDETQRFGRLGSFVFSIGPIRNQAFRTAISALNYLENDRVYVNNKFSKKNKLNGLINGWSFSREKIELQIERITDLFIREFSSIHDKKGREVLRQKKELILTKLENELKGSIPNKEEIQLIIQKTELYSKDIALKKLTDIRYVTLNEEK